MDFWDTQLFKIEKEMRGDERIGIGEDINLEGSLKISKLKSLNKNIPTWKRKRHFFAY